MRRGPKGAPAPDSPGEAAFDLSLRIRGWAGRYQREYAFHSDRKWRFDFAFPAAFVAVEIEGAVAKMGRHQRPAGFAGDLEKYNAAAKAGWCVLRYTTSQAMTLQTADDVIEIVTARAAALANPETLSEVYRP